VPPHKERHRHEFTNRPPFTAQSRYCLMAGEKPNY
jgi:hypothetical protein